MGWRATRHGGVALSLSCFSYACCTHDLHLGRRSLSHAGPPPCTCRDPPLLSRSAPPQRRRQAGTRFLAVGLDARPCQARTGRGTVAVAARGTAAVADQPARRRRFCRARVIALCRRRRLRCAQRLAVRRRRRSRRCHTQLLVLRGNRRQGIRRQHLAPRRQTATGAIHSSAIVPSHLCALDVPLAHNPSLPSHAKMAMGSH